MVLNTVPLNGRYRYFFKWRIDSADKRDRADHRSPGMPFIDQRRAKRTLRLGFSFWTKRYRDLKQRQRTALLVVSLILDIDAHRDVWAEPNRHRFIPVDFEEKRCNRKISLYNLLSWTEEEAGHRPTESSFMERSKQRRHGFVAPQIGDLKSTKKIFWDRRQEKLCAFIAVLKLEIWISEQRRTPQTYSLRNDFWTEEARYMLRAELTRQTSSWCICIWD